MALLAKERAYSRPELLSDETFDITDGRHVTVEALQPDAPFIANDLNLDSDSRKIILLTGANMGGKSTYLRQNAIIVLLAQMGSFVPARRAKIGIVDSVFSRVGSSDDIARNKSTFMLEMTETAAILRFVFPFPLSRPYVGIFIDIYY